MRVLIVEDDHNQSEWIRVTLEQHFYSLETMLIPTELDFRTKLGEIANSPPDIIILDIMLRWTKPSPSMILPPPEIAEEGFYTAGLRCEKLLAQDDRTKRIPVILYTVLDRIELNNQIQELRQGVNYLRKKLDPKQLIQRIQDLRNADKQKGRIYIAKD